MVGVSVGDAAIGGKVGTMEPPCRTCGKGSDAYCLMNGVLRVSAASSTEAFGSGRSGSGMNVDDTLLTSGSVTTDVELFTQPETGPLAAEAAMTSSASAGGQPLRLP